MKHTKRLAFAAMTLGLAMASTHTLAREFAEIYTQCGLGALIAPKSDAVAAVTNVTWDLGTTAVSSNVSSPDSCQGGQEKTASFIHQGYDQLELDLAKGEGEYLHHLLGLMGVEADRKAAVVERIRADLTQVLESGTYATMTRYEKSQALYQIVSGDIS